MVVESPVSVVLNYVEKVNQGDFDGIVAMTAKDVMFTDYEGDVYYEFDFMQKYLLSYPEYQILVDHVLQGGTGAAIIGKTSGSHLTPEREEAEILIWTAEIRDGLIAEWRIYKGEL